MLGEIGRSFAPGTVSNEGRGLAIAIGSIGLATAAFAALFFKTLSGVELGITIALSVTTLLGGLGGSAGVLGLAAIMLLGLVLAAPMPMTFVASPYAYPYYGTSVIWW